MNGLFLVPSPPVITTFDFRLKVGLTVFPASFGLTGKASPLYPILRNVSSSVGVNVQLEEKYL